MKDTTAAAFQRGLTRRGQVTDQDRVSGEDETSDGTREPAAAKVFKEEDPDGAPSGEESEGLNTLEDRIEEVKQKARDLEPGAETKENA
jgi:hypothetical protein